MSADGRTLGTRTFVHSSGMFEEASNSSYRKPVLTNWQKNDSYPSKEIAIITLTRIYTLLNEYQALVREIASPTLPAFVTACLQIVKPPASSKAGPPPLRLVEAVANALCTVTPLYPTTLRPFSAQIKAAFRVYVAPTQADGLVAPQTLSEASRRLFVLQHYTTPKNGNAEEWAKTIGSFIKTAHNTGDHVFRAVQESWEPSSNYTRQSVSYDGQAHGGGDAAEEFPAWIGVPQGSDRLIGLIQTIGEFFKSPTKCPVVTPVSQVLDLTSRITMILPPQKASKSQDDIHLNAAIGREEKDELWSTLPEIHVAIIDLLISLVQRLQENAVSLAADILHQTVRVFDAEHQVPLVRERAYILFKELLLLHGPTMPKISVNSLDKAVQSCCRDILSASGHAGPKRSEKQESKPQTSSKPSVVKPSTNADAYLNTQSKSAAAAAAAVNASTAHITDAASTLLPLFLSHLPQEHLKQTLRALIDRTAVLSHNKDVMISSVLNPYRTRTGKTLASVFPFLARDFPRDQSVEVLRSNLRAGAAMIAAEANGDNDDEELLDRMQADSQDEGADDDDEVANGNDEAGADEEDEKMADAEDAPRAGFDLSSVQAPVKESVVVEKEISSEVVGSEASVTQTKATTVMLSTTLKHKSEELEEPPAKRLDTGGKALDAEAAAARMEVNDDAGANDGSDSDSDLDVQLNATLEDDSEEEDDG